MHFFHEFWWASKEIELQRRDLEEERKKEVLNVGFKIVIFFLQRLARAVYVHMFCLKQTFIQCLKQTLIQCLKQVLRQMEHPTLKTPTSIRHFYSQILSRYCFRVWLMWMLFQIHALYMPQWFFFSRDFHELYMFCFKQTLILCLK